MLARDFDKAVFSELRFFGYFLNRISSISRSSWRPSHTGEELKFMDRHMGCDAEL
jgi:hypothetical protein